MDDRGFIFTTDATLALVVVIVLTTSIVSYQMIPAYMGQDHQHLQALADSALAVMEQDGTLNNAAVEAARNNTTGAQQILNNRLSILIPPDTAYRLNLQSSNLVTVEDNRGLTYSRDSVTKVKVISGPEEGWMGRAWYKIEKFEFENQTQTVTTTFWNFHNWLNGNFFSSNGTFWNRGLINRPFWGGNDASSQSPRNISFSIPGSITLNNVKYLIGSCNRSGGASFSANTTVNGAQTYPAFTNQFTFLNVRPTTSNRMYNFQGSFNTTGLSQGALNNFYVRFWNMSGTSSTRYDMAWFSILGNYTTSFPVPKGILSQTYYFNDAAGMAVPTAQNLGGGGGEYGRIYNLNTGAVSSFTNRRVLTWVDMVNRDHGFDNGVPFVIDGVNGGSEDGSAVSVVKDVNIPAAHVIFDSFVVVNAYGGVDQALIEVYNGTTWRTIFNSQGSSARSDGYGNVPGIVYIPTGYLIPGANNKVRITVWDDVPGNDYDLAGLVNCFVSASYSALNVNWVNYPYDNYQSSNNVRTQTRNFTIGDNAKEVLLFVGTGTDSRNITVRYPSPGPVLYNGSIPYYLNLASLDAALPVNQRRITTSNSTSSQYYLIEDTTHNLTVSVSAPANSWESGDGASSPPSWANAELFSGTRVAVLYPESLRNIWTISYSSTAQAAMDRAKARLIEVLGTDPGGIKTEALFTGDMPNQVPVRLDLWKQ